MVATCVVPPPELATAPLLDPVSHVNDDNIVRKCEETELKEDSCAIPTPVQVQALEQPASPSNSDFLKFQSCNHTPHKFQSCDHTTPALVPTPLDPIHSPAEDPFGLDDDDDDCDELTWIANMAKAFPPGSLPGDSR